MFIIHFSLIRALKNFIICNLSENLYSFWVKITDVITKLIKLSLPKI